MATAGQVSLWAATRPGAALTPLRSRFSDAYELDGGLEIVVFSAQSELEAALQRLRAAAEAAAAAGAGRSEVYSTAPARHSKAPMVGIDVEWRPDFRPGSNNPVALVQLAADGLCVLVRTCCLGFPAALRAFLSDRRLCFVGLNWSVNDERKMASSFGWQTSDFGSFVDLARLAASSSVAHGLGARPGLAALADIVLGLSVPKNKQITLSDWAGHSLSSEQIKYAALDAALVWHIACRLG
ncbi:Werner Syndrome-like exonuclease [Chlorella sorokiniana]|uniref:Werner Syndrome-like exonuclease n=1 Tax=Chlorella sorokiniana TaxID=3076 RepID=A0A2P6TXW3_CHLSO|nr:Werner Syndrome-like exonuclease [Chlorella sorokiniana]|eukprot:PRW58907.1 Werner Syndrome-like exonuclease [Chlorella sorokiniana]